MKGLLSVNSMVCLIHFPYRRYSNTYKEDLSHALSREYVKDTGL